MDCGVFLPITNNGWIISENSPQYMPTFDLNRRICDVAEKHDFEFALSMVKFRGFEGKTEYWDYAVESLTLMSALAVTTSKMQLYASVACPTLHPAMVARMAATISDISDGRFGINIVSGWNKFEYSQMGMWPDDSFLDSRYDYSTEYVEVMRALWETGRASYKGEYFTLDDCFCKPTPTGRIPIVCAGQSDRGMQMTAEVGDYNFVLGSLAELASARQRLDLAADNAGRSVGAYALFGIIADETDEEAIARANHYLDGTDFEALDNQARYFAKDAAGGVIKQVMSHMNTRPVIEMPDNGLAASVQGNCFSIPHLVGSYDRIARHLDASVTEARMDGAIMTYPDFVEDLDRFGEHVIPRLTTRKQMG